MEPTLEHRIRQRAYEIWHGNGCAEGRADEHWLAAEREVLAAAVTLTAAPAAAAPRNVKRGNRAERRAKVAKRTAVA